MNGICLRDLARITRGEMRLGSMPPLGGDLQPVGRIVIDSRQVQPGDVFWGLIGRFHDGSCFAEEAFLRGASGVVVAGRTVEPWAGKFSLQVEDANWALWQLARSVRRRFRGSVIAVTGDGSQSVLRNMLHSVLGAHLTGSASWIDPQEKTALPFAMLDLCDDHDFSVFEMPICPRGEIQSQSHLCDPQIGVINCHAISRYSKIGFASAGAHRQHELLSGLARDSWAVLSSDFPGLRNLAKNVKANVVWTGCGSDADVTAEHIEVRNGELQFSIDGLRFQIPRTGRHHLSAALATYAVGRAIGLTAREIAIGFAQYQGVRGCCETIRTNEHTVINDLSDDAVSTALGAFDHLREFAAAGNRIIVCGDLSDAAFTTEQLTKEIGEAVVTRCGADWFLAYGEQADGMAAAARSAGMPRERAVTCPSISAVETFLKNTIEPHDVVLVKGKQKAELQSLVDELTQPQRTRFAA